MTIEEFKIKRENIEQTNPAPESLSAAQKVRFYTQIAHGWIDELDSVDDAKEALREEREIVDKALSN